MGANSLLDFVRISMVNDGLGTILPIISPASAPGGGGDVLFFSVSLNLTFAPP